VLAQGLVQTAANRARRSVHALEIQREVNVGPVEGRFERTAEKLTRPMVRRFCSTFWPMALLFGPC
jgi:hypothetical protein